MHNMQAQDVNQAEADVDMPMGEIAGVTVMMQLHYTALCKLLMKTNIET